MVNFFKWLGRIVSGFIVAVVAILVLHAGFVKLQDYERSLVATPPVYLRPPYLHLGNQNPINVLHPNQFFFVHVDNARTKDCTAAARYRIISSVPDTNSQHTVVWFSYGETIGFTSAGNYEGDTLLRIPEWLPTGNYMLDRYAAYTCEGGIRIDTPFVGKLPFTIELPAVTNQDLTAPAETP